MVKGINLYSTFQVVPNIQSALQDNRIDLTALANTNIIKTQIGRQPGVNYVSQRHINM